MKYYTTGRLESKALETLTLLIARPSDCQKPPYQHFQRIMKSITGTNRSQINFPVPIEQLINYNNEVRLKAAFVTLKLTVFELILEIKTISRQTAFCRQCIEMDRLSIKN